MRLIPVIDVRGGTAVAAVGGRRAAYRPVVVPWCEDSDPARLADAIRRRYRVETIYVADLDAIEGHAARVDPARMGPIWLDRGTRDARDLDAAETLPADVTLVAGLETLAGAEVLAALVDRLGPDRIVFSLDLRDGSPMARGPAWPEGAAAIARAAVEAGVRRLLLLDVGRVGGGSGLAGWSVPLLASLRAAGLEAEWSAGGGLREAGELAALRGAGFSNALVGAALRDGRLDGELLREEGIVRLAPDRPGPELH